jgi:hypothetical protein
MDQTLSEYPHLSALWNASDLASGPRSTVSQRRACRNEQLGFWCEWEVKGRIPDEYRHLSIDPWYAACPGFAVSPVCKISGSVRLTVQGL